MLLQIIVKPVYIPFAFSGFETKPYLVTFFYEVFNYVGKTNATKVDWLLKQLKEDRFNYTSKEDKEIDWSRYEGTDKRKKW